MWLGTSLMIFKHIRWRLNSYWQKCLYLFSGVLCSGVVFRTLVHDNTQSSTQAWQCWRHDHATSNKNAAMCYICFELQCTVFLPVTKRELTKEVTDFSACDCPALPFFFFFFFLHRKQLNKIRWHCEWKWLGNGIAVSGGAFIASFFQWRGLHLRERVLITARSI